MSPRGNKNYQIVDTCACVCLMLLACVSAEAQQALPVGLSFAFSDPQIVSLFDSDTQRQQAEQQINAQFITHLQSRLRYWTFAATSATTKASFKLGLRESESQAVTLWAVLLNGSNEVGHWEKVVYPPGELIRLGMPTANQWVAKLPAVFDQGLLQLHNQEILEALKGVAPVGKEMILMPAATDPNILPRAVLALDSTEYDDLQNCEFRLRYDWSSGGKVTIHSSGIGMHAPFAPAAPPYDGIVVQLEKWQQGGNTQDIGLMRNHLPELTPVEFYLDVIKGPGSD